MKNLGMSVLHDFYGCLLTDKQRSVIECYYNEDFTLAEIAENLGISRQGVRDAIKHAEAQLQDLDDKLNLVSEYKRLRTGLKEMYREAKDILDMIDENTTDEREKRLRECANNILNMSMRLSE